MNEYDSERIAKIRRKLWIFIVFPLATILTVAIIFFFSTYEQPGTSNKTIVISYPEGPLNFYESSDGYQLSISEYETVCKNTHSLTTGTILKANLYNSNASQLYNNNGKIIDSSSIEWNSSSKKCYAEYKISGLLDGSNLVVTVSGQVLSFINNGEKFLVDSIRNY